MLLFAFISAVAAIMRGRLAGSPRPAYSLLLVPSLLLLLAFVIACTIGVARIYVGIHYPGDILGGALDGLLAALLITLLSRWLRQFTQAVLRLAYRLRLA